MPPIHFGALLFQMVPEEIKLMIGDSQSFDLKFWVRAEDDGQKEHAVFFGNKHLFHCR